MAQSIAIPSDQQTVLVLLALQSAGLVTFERSTGLTNTPFDVTSNLKYPNY